MFYHLIDFKSGIQIYPRIRRGEFFLKQNLTDFSQRDAHGTNLVGLEGYFSLNLPSKF